MIRQLFRGAAGEGGPVEVGEQFVASVLDDGPLSSCVVDDVLGKAVVVNASHFGFGVEVNHDGVGGQLPLALAPPAVAINCADLPNPTNIFEQVNVAVRRLDDLCRKVVVELGCYVVTFDKANQFLDGLTLVDDCAGGPSFPRDRQITVWLECLIFRLLGKENRR